MRGLLRRSLSLPDVDDWVQETFLRLFRDVRRLTDDSLLRSFLVGITMRVGREELRRRKVRRILSFQPSEELVDLAVFEGEDFAGREALRSLYRILDDLSADARLAFVLRHVERLALPEVAAALGCSLATTKRRLSRASEVVCRRASHDPHLREYLRDQAGTDSAPKAVSHDR